MFNYIHAEFYKLRRKKILWIGIAILLVLESALFLPPENWEAESGLAIFIGMTLLMKMFLPLGLFLAPVFAGLVFDSQHGFSTLKNEIVYGIPRSRIYLGKLLTAMLAGTAAAGIALLWYVLTGIFCILRSGGITEPVPSEFWLLLLMMVVRAWFTWLAALSFTMFLLFVLKSSSGALTLVYAISAIWIPVTILGLPVEPSGKLDWLYWLARLYYAAPFYGIWDASFEVPAYTFPSFVKGTVNSWGWILTTTALGLGCFRRQEIT